MFKSASISLLMIIFWLTLVAMLKKRLKESNLNAPIFNPFPITVDIPGVRYVDETEVDETPHQPKEHTFHASAPGELARAPEFTRKRPKTPKKQSVCVTLPPIGKEKAANSKAAE